MNKIKKSIYAISLITFVGAGTIASNAATPSTSSNTIADNQLMTYANNVVQYIANHGGPTAQKTPSLTALATAIKALPVVSTISVTQTATSFVLTSTSTPSEKLEIKLINGKYGFLKSFAAPANSGKPVTKPTTKPVAKPTKKK